MKKKFLRWWYRITGKKALAEKTYQWMEVFDLLESVIGEPTALKQWQKDFGHIMEVYEGHRPPDKSGWLVKAQVDQPQSSRRATTTLSVNHIGTFG